MVFQIYLKKGTQDKRREVKEESQKKREKALEEGRIEDARKYAVRTSRMSRKIVEGSKKLLELLGVPYIQAMGEGEAQASYMVEMVMHGVLDHRIMIVYFSVPQEWLET